MISLGERKGGEEQGRKDKKDGGERKRKEKRERGRRLSERGKGGERRELEFKVGEGVRDWKDLRVEWIRRV